MWEMKLAPIDELAKEFNVHRTTIYRLVKRHGLQTYRRTGDRRTWLDRDTLAPLLDFQPTTPAHHVGEEITTTNSATPLQLDRPSVAACYIVRNGRLLMLRRRFREGTLEWAGPSGGIEPGETPEQAAVREVQEEVGVKVEVIRRLGDRVHPATGRHLIYLACRIVEGDPVLIDHEEISAIEWADLATVKERWATLKGGIFPPVLEYLEQTMAPTESKTEQR